MSTNPASYKGEIAWVSGPEETGQVLRAVFKSANELVLEIDHGGNLYVVDLQTSSPTGRGRWQGRVLRQNGTGGTCSARVFRGDDDLFLFGSWSQGGSTWVFWTELEREDP